MYICVANWDANNRVTHETHKPDEASAIAAVEMMKTEGFTEAFYALSPGPTGVFLYADPVAKTVTDNVTEHTAMVDTVKWESDMAVATRDMPDCVEAVIDSMDEAQLGRLDQAAKDYLAAKKTVRETKPEAPE
jgi:hypothetical protein